ncbi:MAG TPA: hypothetical protein VFL47_01030 [Flavisolibacter sp.]|nr:hypothetical protein [Flavisolibacter sp.]
MAAEKFCAKITVDQAAKEWLQLHHKPIGDAKADGTKIKKQHKSARLSCCSSR